MAHTQDSLLKMERATKDKIKKLIQNDKTETRQLAIEMGVTKTMVSKLNNGTSVPSAKIIRIICMHYGVSADWLMGLDNRPDVSEQLTEKNRKILDVFADFLLAKQKAEARKRVAEVEQKGE